MFMLNWYSKEETTPTRSRNYSLVKETPNSIEIASSIFRIFTRTNTHDSAARIYDLASIRQQFLIHIKERQSKHLFGGSSDQTILLNWHRHNFCRRFGFQRLSLPSELDYIITSAINKEHALLWTLRTVLEMSISIIAAMMDILVNKNGCKNVWGKTLLTDR